MDVVGRGDSDWLENKADYGFTQYVADAAALLARLTAPRASLLTRLQGAGGPHIIDWVGTSMGGLIGMMVAAEPGSPIRGLVLNDVGPLIPWPALARLKLAGGDGARFASVDEVEAYLREACASFGPLADAQWRRLAMHGSRRGEKGDYVLAYDPSIVSTMRGGGGAGVAFGADFFFGIDLWKIWDAVKSPTLVLRGKESDLLLESTVKRMQERGPRMKAVEFSGIGHAPWLMSEDQIRPIADFLLT
jgi:pimeloyl-ACP methyl ester carboxylesterase